MFRLLGKIQRITSPRLPNLVTGKFIESAYKLHTDLTSINRLFIFTSYGHMRIEFRCLQSSRNLFSASSLSINGHLAKRDQTKSYFADRERAFKSRIKQFVDSPPSRDNMIFTQDVKNMLHLVENEPRDIELLMKVLRKYTNQEPFLSTDNYLFGPVLMRLLHVYKLDDVALTVWLCELYIRRTSINNLIYCRHLMILTSDIFLNKIQHISSCSTYYSVKIVIKMYWMFMHAFQRDSMNRARKFPNI